MSSFFSFIIVAVIAIAAVVYWSSGAANKKKKPQAYHHRCPYCGADYGELPRDRAVCGDCRRTYVIGRAPTAEEQGVMQREVSEIAFIQSPSFPLDAVRSAVAAAFCNEKKYVTDPEDSCYGIQFLADHLEACVNKPYREGYKLRILDYPPIGTEAAMHVLTEACFRYLKDLYPSQCSLRGAETGEYAIVWKGP